MGLAKTRIALGPFDRFLVLYGAMFAAFGVASPFLPALLHERGLGPSEIGAVLAAGTAIRLITGPTISRLADRLGKHRQTLAMLLAIAAVIAFGYDLPAGFAIFLIVSVAHASPLVLSRVHWVEPKLVAEITYLTRTADDLLRHTVYVGLREDKPATDVRREVGRT
jgi:MFS family permease